MTHSAKSIVLAIFVVVSAIAPAAVPAQTRNPAAEFFEIPQRGPWWTLWSWESPHHRVVAAMTSMHLYELELGFKNNWAFGAVGNGLFAATFITTHGPRGWVAGFERAWLEGSAGPVRTMVGFRAGLVYGYDHRLGQVADKIPILPYGQPVVMARLGPASVDFTYTWVVVSLTAGVAVW